MQEVLCRSHHLGSYFLRLCMGLSRWSHCAVYDEEEDVVYETTWTGGGCKVLPAVDFFNKQSKCERRPLDLYDVAGARTWLRKQTGKGYDWTALIGFVPLIGWCFRRDWQEDDKWFCTEHLETLRALFGTPKFRALPCFLTPLHQDLVA